MGVAFFVFFAADVVDIIEEALVESLGSVVEVLVTDILGKLLNLPLFSAEIFILLHLDDVLLLLDLQLLLNLVFKVD